MGAPSPEDEAELKRLGEVLDLRRDEIIERWSKRVRDELGVRELERSELLDAMPDYLRGLAELVRSDHRPPGPGGGSGLWADVAREHALTRVRQGFDIASLFREFTILRAVLVEVVHEETFRRESVFEALTEAIEAAMQRAVESYVESRDNEARRVEAEHVAFITHELRNPLGTAMLGVSQLREQLTSGPSELRLLDLVARAHDKLDGLIDGVLTIEKAQAGELDARRVETRLATVIEEAVTGAREEAKLKRIPLEVRCDPTLSVPLDPRLTTSAIQNLVDNAIKYGGAGPVEVWTESTEEQALVHVTDRCGGLSPAELKTIFLPFRRGRQQREERGTGLGLSITQRAVEAQGGSVHAETTGDGCHFWIALRRAPEEPEEERADPWRHRDGAGAHRP
jgi:signal transduction histidine kinase